MIENRETEFFVVGRHAPAGGRKLGYVEWGDSSNSRVAVCVHGLTRNCRDFDWLARSLAETHRVLAIDVAGRGRSEWPATPAGYAFDIYIDDIRELLVHLGIAEVDWVGTSMGGVMGMLVAGSAAKDERRLIRKLVLNDIGPFLASAPMTALAARVGHAPSFADMGEAEAYQREVCSAWGTLPADRWVRLAEHSVREVESGGYTYHHDPRIGDVVRARMPAPDLDIWPIWDRIECPVLVTRGADSEILSASTASEMTGRGPGATLVEYPGIGHTPSLMVDDQIATVVNWIRS